MVTVPFGEYLPDLSAVNNPGMTVADNAVPLGVGYKELKSPSIVSDALDARVRHFVALSDASNVYSTYAGDATKLYILANVTWSGAGAFTLTEEDLWESAQWDTKIVFTNINDEPVQATIGSGTFAVFFTSTEKPKAHHVAVVGDTLVMGDINSTANGIKRNGVIWSALGNYLDMDPATATNAGAQDLRGDGGDVQKIIGGRTGIIFQRNAIWRMSFSGPPTLHRFDNISRNIGAISKNGTAAGADGNNIFFLAEEGFHLLHEPSGTIKSIGNNRVDETVLAEIDKTTLHRSSVAVDDDGLFYFSYSTGGGDPDKIVIYNPHQDRWGTGVFNHQIIGVYRGGAQDIDSAPLASRDIDADPYLIDSAEFKGGVPNLAVFDTANRLASLESTAQTATFETGEAALVEGRRNYVNRVRPIVTGAGASSTVTLGTRELLTEASVFGTETSANAEGEVPVRGSGRYMKFRITVSGGFDDAIAIEVEPKARGRK
jgi:hypothetical protein